MTAPGLILQHGDTAPPGLLEAFLRERGIAYRVHRVWEAPVPDLTALPWVASLGSEHSAGGAEPAWVPVEVDALRRAAEADVPVLGLCFGGQALALALGGGVHRTPVPEIGWVAVESEDPGVPAGPYAQYHYELLEVPPGAREVARSPAGPAAFRAGPHLGLQFHPEVEREQMEWWLDMDPDLPAGFDHEAALRGGRAHAEDAAARAVRLFAAWFDSVGS